MKKAIALLIVVVMAATLVACNGGSTSDSSGTSTSPGTSDSPGTSPSTETSSTPATSGTSGNETSGGNESQGNEPQVAAGQNFSDAANILGFFADGVDPHSRDTLDIVYSYMLPLPMMLAVGSAIRELQSVFNFNMIEYNANNDLDAFIQNIQLYADQGVHGFVTIIEPTATHRVMEIFDATGLPYVSLLNVVRDDQGHNLVPVVGMDDIKIGNDLISWLFDNYKDYWGDVSFDNAGLIPITFSLNIGLNNRAVGCIQEWNRRLPGNNNIFEADGVTGGLNEETAYDIVSAIIAAHQEIDRWFITGPLEAYALGAVRATEHLGVEDRTLIASFGSDALVAYWDTGYDGNWVACVPIAPYMYAIPMLAATISMHNGTSDRDSLWSKFRASGDVNTMFQVPYEVVSQKTYKDFMEKYSLEAWRDEIVNALSR